VKDCEPNEACAVFERTWRFRIPKLSSNRESCHKLHKTTKRTIFIMDHAATIETLIAMKTQEAAAYLTLTGLYDGTPVDAMCRAPHGELVQ
jgi:hypothetical protein